MVNFRNFVVVSSVTPFYSSFAGIFSFIVLLIEKREKEKKISSALEGILKLSSTFPIMLFYFLAK